MEPENFNQRLSRISTQWSLVFQAHTGDTTTGTVAQQLLMQRYSGAVYRYLLGAVRDADVAEELSQEFALRFVRGDFRRADPRRGRFRDYVKTALVHLVTDYHRSRQAWPRQWAAEGPEPAAPDSEAGDDERAFLRCWQEELLERSWKALKEAQPKYYAVLRFRVQDPDVPSAQMAEQLALRLGQLLTAAGVRKALQRAHEMFADLLLEEVSATLAAASVEALEEELRELDLLKYCRTALERRNRQR